MPSQPSSTKAKHWILTIPVNDFTPIYLPTLFIYLHGQLEEGTSTGYRHYQVYGITKQQVRLSAIKKVFGRAHIEATRSEAGADYCLKEETQIRGTQFQLGEKPLNRNSAKDWEAIKAAAVEGRMDDVPPDVYVRYYNSLSRIGVDNSRPVAIERKTYVFWGATGVGKSRKAWELAGIDAYPKDPNTKFWDGYRDHRNVVIDEFRGTIGISHLLRWLDRYPVLVEIKGSSRVLKAENIYITSNLDPREWYKDLDQETVNALLRRLTITYCPTNMYQN